LVNLQRYEIADTWIIGNNGAFANVFAIANNATTFFAATNEGLKQCISTTNSVLRNFNNWQTLVGNGLQAGAIQFVGMANNNLIVQKSDSVFIQRNNSWQLLYAANNTTIRNVNISSNKILVSASRASTAFVLQINNNGVIEQTVQNATNIQQPNNAVLFNNSVVIADGNTGLLQLTNNTFTSLTPQGPYSNTNAAMAFLNDTLIVTAGMVTNNFTNTNNTAGFYKFINNEEWINYNKFSVPSLDTVVDCISVATNTINNTNYIGSFGGGLVANSGNNISIFKRGVVQPQISNANAFNVSGLAFDNNNNLWMSNYGAALALTAIQPNNIVQNFSIPLALTNNAVSNITIDDANQLWITSPNGNGLICYNYGNSVTQLNDDKWRLLKLGAGAGGLPSNFVNCTTKDKNGFIWIGTTRGIGVVQCPTEVFTQNCEAILPIVQQDQFAGFLFQDENVQAIAVDGANRKWVGTQNGVWLLSPDGDKIIYRFSQNNSPLLSNNIFNIAIHPITGEVFFGTANGICSFRSTATEATETANNVLVFPNPVPPNFNGTIAIRGVPNNSIVKITEPNGRLVFQTRSVGSQAVWNGKNYKGETINTGVYLVFAQTDDATEKLVTKIVLVGK
jgi:hypothetical protein